MVGKTLGPYKIIEQIGAGGMGEVYVGEDTRLGRKVYVGEDTRLGRKVAIKVLPAEFASDPERLARFEQEARAAAALNHPHIAVVHDVGSEPGEDGATTHFMVQEYLEGQSLRERLEKVRYRSTRRWIWLSRLARRSSLRTRPGSFIGT